MIEHIFIYKSNRHVLSILLSQIRSQYFKGLVVQTYYYIVVYLYHNMYEEVKIQIIQSPCLLNVEKTKKRITNQSLVHVYVKGDCMY